MYPLRVQTQTSSFLLSPVNLYPSIDQFFRLISPNFFISTTSEITIVLSLPPDIMSLLKFLLSSSEILSRVSLSSSSIFLISSASLLSKNDKSRLVRLFKVLVSMLWYWRMETLSISLVWGHREYISLHSAKSYTEKTPTSLYSNN